MDSEDFEVLEQIGEGSFSRVFLGQNKKDKIYYALKCFNLTLLSKKRVLD